MGELAHRRTFKRVDRLRELVAFRGVEAGSIGIVEQLRDLEQRMMSSQGRASPNAMGPLIADDRTAT